MQNILKQFSCIDVNYEYEKKYIFLKFEKYFLSLSKKYLKL